MKWKFLLERCKIYMKVDIPPLACGLLLKTNHICCNKYVTWCFRSFHPTRWRLGPEGWSWPARWQTPARWNSICLPCCSGADQHTWTQTEQERWSVAVTVSLFTWQKQFLIECSDIDVNKYRIIYTYRFYVCGNVSTVFIYLNYLFNYLFKCTVRLIEFVNC